MENAKVDVISEGRAFGATASRLLSVGMQPAKLRTNDLLPLEVWKQWDSIILKEFQKRLVGVADIFGAGLEYDLRSVGLGKTVLQWSTASDFGPAEISMDGVNNAKKDRVLFDHANLLPLFITHKDVSFTAREIAESRNSGTPLDTVNIELASRKIAESVETLLFQGPSSAIQLPTVWGNAKSYGYQTALHLNSGNIVAGGWNGGGVTAVDIKKDILKMKAALIAARAYGPYQIYVPTSYEVLLDDDYVATTATITTIRERILSIGNIAGIKVADFMTDESVLMIQMSREVVDMVVCVDPMIIPWEEEGGMRINFKIITVMVPRVKYTQASRSGIAYYTKP